MDLDIITILATAALVGPAVKLLLEITQKLRRSKEPEITLRIKHPDGTSTEQIIELSNERSVENLLDTLNKPAESERNKHEQLTTSQ